jgi:hypothetical protein
MDAMTLRLQVKAHMVRVDLHDTGHLLVSPGNPAVAIAYLHLDRREDVTLVPDDVEAVRDMVPALDGIKHGWIDVCTRAGVVLRIPYLKRTAPLMRELMRVMEQEFGYPPRDEIGVREDTVPVGLEDAFPAKQPVAEQGVLL